MTYNALFEEFQGNHFHWLFERSDKRSDVLVVVRIAIKQKRSARLLLLAITITEIINSSLDCDIEEKLRRYLVCKTYTFCLITFESLKT